MSTKLLTTGQAAKLCSVNPDTVLKWIRSGWLRAHRTAGGHHRIDRRDLSRILEDPPNDEIANFSEPEKRHFRYCWEFNGRGKLLEGCRECTVYKMRAQRCYEVVKFASTIGHNKIFCKESCQECDYYQQVHEQAANILMVTDNEIWAASLKREVSSTPFNLEITKCEYTSSAIVDQFKPDYVVVDCSLGPDRSRDICRHIIEDPRIPHSRVILAVNPGEEPDSCDRDVFARIEKPFKLVDIIECINGAEEESSK